jgi:ankyrin repeat protein
MSFGFGIGDFVTLSTLTVSLYRSFKCAPDEFSEISRQLQSLHIAIAELSDQAQQENSLLKRNGANRSQELFTIRENLLKTLKELEDLHKRYQQMGRISWSRFQLGQESLTAIREKLTMQISALNAFIGSLAIAALGRMEPMIQRIHDLLDERARGSAAAAQSVLSAASDRPDAWEFLELDLKTEGIPLEYIQNNRQAIQTALLSVVESSNLAGDRSDLEINGPTGFSALKDDSICADDSASQLCGPPKEVGILGISEQLPSRSIRLSVTENKGKSSPLKELSAKDEATRILIMNHTGFDLSTMRGTLSHLVGTVVTKNPPEARAVRWAATYAASKEPLRLLLDRGCHLSPPGKGGSTVFAAARGHLWGNVKLLLEHGAKFGKHLLHMASMADEADIVRLLLARGISVDMFLDMTKVSMTSKHKFKGRWTPLHIAAWNASLDLTTSLLDHSAQINQRTKSMNSGRPFLLRVLDGDMDWDSTALHLALARPGKESLAVAKVLVDRGAEMDAKGYQFQGTPLHITVRNDDIDAVSFLLNNGAKIDAVDYEWNTPLNIAAGEGNLYAVNYLLSRGAHVNAENGAGWPPLQLGAYGNHASTIDALLNRGADIDAEYNHSVQPGRSGPLSRLLQPIRETALGVACAVRAKEAAKCLLMHGASYKKLDLQRLQDLCDGNALPNHESQDHINEWLESLKWKHIKKQSSWSELG